MPGHGVVATVTYTREGGGSEAKKKNSLCSYNRCPSSGPFHKFHFFPEEEFSGVSGGVGGSGGGAQAANPPPPYPPGNGTPWPARCCYILEFVFSQPLFFCRVNEGGVATCLIAPPPQPPPRKRCLVDRKPEARERARQMRTTGSQIQNIGSWCLQHLFAGLWGERNWHGCEYQIWRWPTSPPTGPRVEGQECVLA